MRLILTILLCLSFVITKAHTEDTTTLKLNLRYLDSLIKAGHDNSVIHCTMDYDDKYCYFRFNPLTVDTVIIEYYHGLSMRYLRTEAYLFTKHYRFYLYRELQIAHNRIPMLIFVICAGKTYIFKIN